MFVNAASQRRRHRPDGEERRLGRAPDRADFEKVVDPAYKYFANLAKRSPEEVKAAEMPLAISKGACRSRVNGSNLLRGDGRGIAVGKT
jgi:hypothetical protein